MYTEHDYIEFIRLYEHGPVNRLLEFLERNYSIIDDGKIGLDHHSIFIYNVDSLEVIKYLEEKGVLLTIIKELNVDYDFLIERGSLDVINYILDKYSNHIDLEHLWVDAVYKNRVSVMKLLVDKYDVSPVGDNFAMRYAIEHCNLDALNYLLSIGTDWRGTDAVIKNIRKSYYHWKKISEIKMDWDRQQDSFLLAVFLNKRLPFKYVRMEILESFEWAECYKPHQLFKFIK